LPLVEGFLGLGARNEVIVLSVFDVAGPLPLQAPLLAFDEAASLGFDEATNAPETSAGREGTSAGFVRRLGTCRVGRTRLGTNPIDPTQRDLITADVGDSRPLVAAQRDMLYRHAGPRG
jgi:hypothetical protein